MLQVRCQETNSFFFRSRQVLSAATDRADDLVVSQTQLCWICHQGSSFPAGIAFTIPTFESDAILISYPGRDLTTGMAAVMLEAPNEIHTPSRTVIRA